jgi:serine/threonine-protein kinase
MARLANWELGVELARGAGGRIVQARDSRGGADRAVKVIPMPPSVDEMATAEIKLRFRREVDLAKGLQHPQVNVLEEAGIADGSLWLATKIPKGQPLADFTAPGRRLEPRRLIRIVHLLAAILDEAQSKGLVRCDLDPENLFLAGDALTVLDLGVARVGDPTRGSHLGSKHFLSPEQIKTGAAGAASNQFALAVLTYHLLTGEWPFPGRDREDDPSEMLLAEPEPIARHRPELPGAVGRALARALHREPTNRFPGTTGLAEAFDRAFDEETVLPPREPSIESGIWPSEPDRSADPTRVSRPDPSRPKPAAAYPIAPSKKAPPWRPLVAIAAVLAAGGVVWLASGSWSREERIARMAERGNLTGASQALDRWRKSDPGAPALALTEGHVAFARKDCPGAVGAYLKAAKADARATAENARLLPHVLACVPDSKSRSGLVSIAPLLPDRVDDELWKDEISDRYWARWNAAKMLEARGHGDRVDWTGLYIADLAGSDSCAVKKKAIEHLGMTHEVRALTAIQAAEDDPKAVKTCRLKKTLADAEAALLAP